MALTQEQFNECLETLFDPTVSVKDDHRLLISAQAFQFLTMEYIDVSAPLFKNRIKFDNIKVVMMLKRFYRDAWGVAHFSSNLDALEKAGKLVADTRIEIEESLNSVSVRINSADPKKTRIAAAFSLWMATFRPHCFECLANALGKRDWHFEADINLWIATSFLRRYGVIRIGDPVRDAQDSDARLRRILYDFTYRDVNLSSLEFMYAFIFVPDPPAAPAP